MILPDDVGQALRPESVGTATSGFRPWRDYAMEARIANLVSAGLRLIPLGQTAAQRAIAELEEAVVSASTRAQNETIEDLGSAAFVVDLVSMEHETQYTRLFRS